mmetsp:Transcript_3175/g.4915  ORF Transcript_3175/g.4915 Transcript_3175/m.4915 type:complete len:307 (-) Transcript_3175:328-1248(-)|eukprot:CAMPEP_0185035682 /NCGR_PEP_ID=MMETSP1103-20130426/27506_1 /TAXON_ID=36769 /ORGANISM="Paraphysomonas bandaiensis, Strain Caron Lab Isolate" /LENGTH=306 /DNA_ID=CAMNT_0027572887 /DNA_START=102 /DNA_END=1022 /DNA_ORIENTATION=+
MRRGADGLVSSSSKNSPINNQRNGRDKDSGRRRKSTGDVITTSKRQVARIQVRHRDDSSLFTDVGYMMDTPETCGPVFMLSTKYEDLEKKIVRDAAGAIRSHPGPDAETLRHHKPRGKMLVDLDGPSIITKHIVIGSKRDAADAGILRRIGITHVLNVAVQLNNNFPGSFIYHKVNMLDSPDTNIMDFYEESVAFIRRVEQLNGRVLVHCVSGVSRSVAIVLLHLMSTYDIFLKHAYNHIRTCRPYIHPNDGFKLQLAQFEISHLGRSSVTRNAGKEWEFYEWNRVKHSYKRQKSVGDIGPACLIL